MEIPERIIIEAGELFSQYGIRSVTMDSLAEDMGISKRTIYENFKDKDTLLLEVIKYYKVRQLQEMDDIIKVSANVVEALFRLVGKMVDTMKQINPIFFQDIKKYHSSIFAKLEGKGEIRDHELSRRILTEGFDQKIFRDDLNLEIVNNTLHELFNIFSPDHQMTRAGYHRGELFNNIILPYLIGISTPKGQKLIKEQGNFIYH